MCFSHTSCYCLLLHFLGTTPLHHLLIQRDNNILTHVMTVHRCQKIMLFCPSWMVWTVFVVYFKFLSPVEQVVIYWNPKWPYLIWVDKRVFRRILTIMPHSRWGYIQCFRHVPLLLRINPLIHWWLLHMNCEILSHHTFGLPSIKSSSYF